MPANYFVTSTFALYTVYTNLSICVVLFIRENVEIW